MPESRNLACIRQVFAHACPRSLEEEQYLGMAVGVQYDMKKVKLGPLGDLTIVQHTVVPILKPGTRCFDLVDKVVGGFTLQVRAIDPHQGPKGRVEYPEY
jgi:hypothetical protein